MMPLPRQDIVFSTLSGEFGNVGLILLNRPQVLNALNLVMLQALDYQLAEWAVDDSIKAVIIRGAGERAFCAGGDLRYIYHLPEHLADHPEHSIFWAEYRINQKIFHFPKPYIALMHGITMGGGVGLSVYASHRIAAPDLSFAMPETKIGFYPDVGACYFLSRCPGHVGIYLGLTGESINAGDAEQLGLVDYVVPHEQFDKIIANIVACVWKESNQDAHIQVNEIITNFKIKSPISNLDSHRIFIDRCFSKDSIEEIFDALLLERNFWCDHVFAHLRSLSPSSLKITLAHFREHAHLSFDECMKIDYRLTLRFIEAHDFKEGVRAAIIHKDKQSQWQPDQLVDVNDDLLEHYARPLDKPQIELSFK